MGGSPPKSPRGAVGPSQDSERRLEVVAVQVQVRFILVQIRDPAPRASTPEPAMNRHDEGDAAQAGWAVLRRRVLFWARAPAPQGGSAQVKAPHRLKRCRAAPTRVPREARTMPAALRKLT
eukprot:2402134-Rhodomonas_salina.2